MNVLLFMYSIFFFGCYVLGHRMLSEYHINQFRISKLENSIHFADELSQEVLSKHSSVEVVIVLS